MPAYSVSTSLMAGAGAASRSLSPLLGTGVCAASTHPQPRTSSTGRKSCSAASFDTLALFRFASVPNDRQLMDLYLVSHLTAINSFVCPAFLAVIMSSSCCGQMRVMTLHDFQRCRAAFPAAEAMLPLVLGTVGNQGCIT